MPNYRRFNPINATLVPDGTRLRFWYGAGQGEETGVVTGRSTNQWGTTLKARMDKDGRTEDVSGISTVGIGVYLLDKAIEAAFFADG